jgi:hypothetical protein
VVTPATRAAQGLQTGFINEGVAPQGGPAVRATVSSIRPAWAEPDLTHAQTVIVGNASTLTIVATFDSSITGDANSASIQSAITSAIATYTTTFSDPITVNMTFKVGGGLGTSSTFFCNGSYVTYLTALKAHATTADDASANSHLASVSANPVNGASTINVKSANLRALGLGCAVTFDGTITVNTALTSPGSPGSSGNYDLISVAQHEIDEVLGMGSSLKPTSPSPLNGTIFPTDLFRYDQNGARTFSNFSTSNPPRAFLSLDGPTRIVQFNNSDNGGDYGDWITNSPAQVQDAFATPGSHPRLGNPEMTNLDVIGFNRLSVATFTDDPLVAGTTTVKAAHITELRTYVNTLRSRYGLSTFSYTDPTITAAATAIKAVHVTELRAALAAVYAAAGLAAPTYTNATLTGGTSLVAAVDITELRVKVKAIY